MHFLDYVESAKEQTYENIPRDSEYWENDVWERIVRPGMANGYKKQLIKAQSQISTAVGQSMFDLVRRDIFDNGPDVVDASVSKYVPNLEITDPSEAIESVIICSLQTGYKLYKWASTTQLSELAGICEHIPHFRFTEYEGLKHQVLVLLTANPAAILQCDAETKPNFSHLRDRKKLYGTLLEIGNRLCKVFHPEED
jgi:hypothetical protein